MYVTVHYDFIIAQSWKKNRFKVNQLKIEK